MFVLLFLFSAIFLVCFGMGMSYAVYLCLLWASMLRDGQQGGAPSQAPAAAEKGLSAAELEQLGRVVDGGAVSGQECVVCLEDIRDGQAARVLPECCHAFHRDCADLWLSGHRDCPLCRAHLHPPPLLLFAADAPRPSVPVQMEAVVIV